MLSVVSILRGNGHLNSLVDNKKLEEAIAVLMIFGSNDNLRILCKRINCLIVLNLIKKYEFLQTKKMFRKIICSYNFHDSFTYHKYNQEHEYWPEASYLQENFHYNRDKHPADHSSINIYLEYYDSSDNETILSYNKCQTDNYRTPFGYLDFLDEHTPFDLCPYDHKNKVIISPKCYDISIVYNIWGLELLTATSYSSNFPRSKYINNHDAIRRYVDKKHKEYIDNLDEIPYNFGLVDQLCASHIASYLEIKDLYRGFSMTCRWAHQESCNLLAENPMCVRVFVNYMSPEYFDKYFNGKTIFLVRHKPPTSGIADRNTESFHTEIKNVKFLSDGKSTGMNIIINHNHMVNLAKTDEAEKSRLIIYAMQNHLFNFVVAVTNYPDIITPQDLKLLMSVKRKYRQFFMEFVRIEKIDIGEDEYFNINRVRNCVQRGRIRW